MPKQSNLDICEKKKDFAQSDTSTSLLGTFQGKKEYIW